LHKKGLENLKTLQRGDLKKRPAQEMHPKTSKHYKEETSRKGLHKKGLRNLTTPKDAKTPQHSRSLNKRGQKKRDLY